MSKVPTILKIFLFKFLIFRTKTFEVQMTDRNLEVRSGDSITLEAQVTEAPEGSTIRWIFNGDDLTSAERSDQSLGGNNYLSQITVPNVSKDHAGTYFCIATNLAEDSQASDFAEVKVKFPPESLDSATQRVRILENFPTRISYNLIGYPDPEIRIYQNENEVIGAYDNKNDTLTLPYLTQNIRTVAANEMGTADLPFEYNIVRLIPSRSISVHSYETYFKIKLSTDVFSDGSSNSVFLVLIEEMSEARFRTAPIEVNLNGFVTCSQEPNVLINNIIDNPSQEVQSNQKLQAEKSFQAPTNFRNLDASTTYLIWILQCETFICPDGFNWALRQPIRSSDYIMAATLPLSETQSEAKTNEIIIAILITIGAVVVLILLASLIFWVLSQKCSPWKQINQRHREMQYFPSEPNQQRALDTTQSFIPVDIATYQMNNQRDPNYQGHNTGSMIQTQDNVYCIPDEYVKHEDLRLPQSPVNIRGVPEDYTHHVAHPIYLGSSMYDLSPINASQAQQRKQSLFKQLYGVENKAFVSSNENLYFNTPVHINPKRQNIISSTPLSGQHSSLQSPRIDKVFVDSSDQQRSSGSSSRTEHASRSSEYYNSINGGVRHFKASESPKTSQFSTYQKQKNRYVNELRVRDVPTIRSMKSLDSKYRLQSSSTTSLPDLDLRTNSGIRGDFNSLPRNYHIPETTLQYSRSLSTGHLFDFNPEDDEEFFYLHI